jgi:hypothetical protein
MFSCRYLTFASRRSRRFLTAVSLVAYLASVWGYPLPQAATQDRSVPFPCQDHHCGCASAEQCWRSCCCFTPAERIAWAEKHDVTIPEPMRVALVAEEHEHHDDETCRAGDVCEVGDTDHKPGACCDHEPGGSERACATCASPQSGTSVGWVSAFEARKCRGLSTLWIVTGAAVPLAIESLWEFEWASAGLVLSVERRLQSVTSLPTVPPPRV